MKETKTNFQRPYIEKEWNSLLLKKKIQQRRGKDHASKEEDLLGYLLFEDEIKKETKETIYKFWEIRKKERRR